MEGQNKYLRDIRSLKMKIKYRVVDVITNACKSII
jgi:hypothetical protein